MASVERRLLRLFKTKGVVRARELDEIGVPRVYLTRLVRRGLLVRAGRGLYSSPDRDIGAHHSLAEAAARLPGGVVCLLSALEYHGIFVEAPVEVWMAALRPTMHAKGSIRIIYMTRAVFRRGMLHEKIDGVSVPIFTLAKTIADCFLYRKKVGLDVAVAALHEYRRSRAWDADELWRYADVCGVTAIMRPYIEALG